MEQGSSRLHIVTCQPIVGLRNRAFLVSCPPVSPRSAGEEEQAAVTSHASPRQGNKQSRHCETPATVGGMSIVHCSATVSTSVTGFLGIGEKAT
jgi:hypothetical protein